MSNDDKPTLDPLAPPSTMTMVILTAASLAGGDPNGFEARTAAIAERLMGMLDPSSTLSFNLRRKAEVAADSQPLRGVILKVEKDPKVNKAIVTFKADKLTQYNERTNGVETIRTDFLATKDGAEAPGRAVANLAVSLIGHEVSMTKRMEKDKPGAPPKGFKTLIAITDMGMSTDPDGVRARAELDAAIAAQRGPAQA